MRQYTKVGLLGVACIALFSSGVYAATVVPKIFINGNEVKTTAEPKLINGSVYVPIRAISEGLGAAIAWDNKSKSVYVNSVPSYDKETDRTWWVPYRNMVFKFIMAYDERDSKAYQELIGSDFTTNVFLEFPTGGYTDMTSIIDYKLIGYQELTDKKQLKFTVQIVKRPTDEDYTV
ncbi:copper amine oxidase N-terminal domain-containing protein [Paenibacillus sp. JDR-2]|uniref:copper amine oxidase N-terminal domain-containing protein n=1 Tax=Paenibacillus sp. (strain JDR-2) TaxID=324057 RepID=UPI0001667BB2|nr:copper amine oxidase N-terminal domain-containing protein [Paenibacillus sp. JDR-2]ACT02342.1 hypothetical protein Pjdr2_3711 [Paenibacillus sp. JDR-2]